MLVYPVAQEREFLDVEGTLVLIECQTGLRESLQDGAESGVVLFGSGASKENVVHVADDTTCSL